MLKLFLTKKFVFEPEEIAVNLILNGLQNNKQDILFTSIDEIGYYLTGRFLDTHKDRRIIAGIKKGISNLIKDDAIKCIAQDKNNYVFNSETCKFEGKENFIILELWEIQKIFTLGTIAFNLLKYYVDIIGTINGKTKSWHMSQESMCDLWNINYVTIDEYNKKLEELELLYIHRSKSRKKDGTFYKVNNVYGRYRDKADIISDATNYLATTELDYYMEKNKLDGDTRTSIKMRYNGFINGAKKYINNQKEIDRLHNDCIRYNETLDKRFTEITPLDLSVFDGLIDEYNSLVPQEEQVLHNDVWGDYKEIIPFGLSDEEVDKLFSY